VGMSYHALSAKAKLVKSFSYFAVLLFS